MVRNDYGAVDSMDLRTRIRDSHSPQVHALSIFSAHAFGACRRQLEDKSDLPGSDFRLRRILEASSQIPQNIMLLLHYAEPQRLHRLGFWRVLAHVGPFGGLWNEYFQAVLLGGVSGTPGPVSGSVQLELPRSLRCFAARLI